MERHVTTADGTLLCIDETGDPEAPLVLQLEGHMAQLIATPASYCERLAAHGFRVVRVDNRDVGRSQRFPGAAYSLADMVEDVHGLLRVLDRPAVVCGRSMGGAIAQLLAITHPQDVLGLGLFFTFAKEARPGEPVPTGPAPISAAPFADEESFVAWEHATLPGIAGSDHPYGAAYLEWVARTAWSRGVDWDGFERQRQAIARTQPWADRLVDVRVPVSIVHGEQDPIVPVGAAHHLAELLPSATLDVVPGLGHQQPAALDGLFVEATLRAVPT